MSADLLSSLNGGRPGKFFDLNNELLRRVVSISLHDVKRRFIWGLVGCPNCRIELRAFHLYLHIP